MTSKTLGAWLKEARRRANLTTAELAERSGVSPTQIWNIETGRTRNPRRSTKQRLTETLTNTDELICSFCGRPRWAAEHMAQSAFNKQLFICDGCITDANDTFTVKRSKASKSPNLRPATPKSEDDLQRSLFE